MTYTKISADAFQELQLNAGVLLSTFDPANPAAPSDADIICTTSGGINASCVPTFSDFGEDVDNCPNNMMEFKRLDGWDCSMAFTSIRFNPMNIKLSLGAADSETTYKASADTTVQTGKTYYTRSGSGTSQSPYVYTPVATPTGNPSTSNYYEASGGTITPRAELKSADFATLWWVGDKTDGGAVAIKLMNALSTGGFSMQTTKNAKGTMAMTITGHVSKDAQSVVPMEFYVIGA